mgnify:CR=1 FL=1
MKLLEFDRKKNMVSLTVENLDDLWHLYNFIQKNDVVYAKTTREIKVRDEMGRKTEGRRVLLTLGIKVTEVLFDKSLNRLRIRGVVIQSPEQYEGIMGSYHTISVQPNNTITVVKQNLTESQLKRIKTACKVRSIPIIVVSIDDEEACIAGVHRFGVDVKFEKRLKLPGKLEAEKRTEAVKKYFSEVLKSLQETLKSTDGFLVIVGPGFIKDEFASYVKDKLKEARSKVHVKSVSSGGLSGINEALRSGVLLKIAKENRLLEETRLVEKFFSDLALETGKVVYGFEEVENAARLGAVKNLLVVDKYLRGASDEERLKLEEIMHTVEDKGGEVIILNSEYEAGEKILSLGGVAAILRFSIR